jgi:hypothetical protein
LTYNNCVAAAIRGELVTKSIFVFSIIFFSFLNHKANAESAATTDLKNTVKNFPVVEGVAQSAGIVPIGCEAKLEETPGPEAKLSVADCSKEITDTDYKIIEKILTDLKALNKSGLDAKSAEYKTAHAKIIEGVDDALSPAAKGMLATEVFKATFTVPNATKEFKNAFSDFEIWAGFHVRSFGPGTDYASMGIMDSVRTPIHWVLDQVNNGGERTPLGIELYEESMLRVHDRWTKLDKAISKLDLPKEEKSALFAKVREYGQMIQKRDGIMLEATQERAQAFQSAVVQIGAAVEAKLISRHIQQAKQERPGAVEALLWGLDEGAAIIFKEHTKLAIKAFQSGGDIGCAWGIMAAKENPEIWKGALKGASMEFVAGLASSNPNFGIAVDTVIASKNSQDVLVDSVGVAQQLLEAKKLFAEAGVLIDQAEKEDNLIKKGKLEKEAREKLREFRELRVDAGMSIYELGVDILDLSSSLKDLKENYKKFAESMKDFSTP